MLHNRTIQFLILYGIGLTMLLLIKYSMGLSDYVIPTLADIAHTAKRIMPVYITAVIESMGIAVMGHVLSIFLASVIGVLSRINSFVGTFIKAAAYQIQSYPVVAIAPIVFILMGDGILPRLLITSMICYFPLLLTFVGVFTEPVSDIEQFYNVTNTLTWDLKIKIRAYEHQKKILTVIEGSATLAMVGTIVAEFISAESGIGYQISIAMSQSDMSKVLIALFLIGLSVSIYLTVLAWGLWGKISQGRP
jgi:ABC-type nitrate/sulfonate/bicarbonate transport system permease component